MTHRSHVPKFGNWDGDNVPYTAYFENARKEKAGIMNPNDPEENPEAFKFGEFGESGDLPRVISAETTELDQFTVGHEKYHNHHQLQINGAGAGYKQHHVHHQRNASDQQQKSSPNSDDKSNSSRSSSTVTKQQQQQQRSHRHKTSDGRKSMQSNSSSGKNSNGFATARPSKGGRNPSDDLSSRSSSVPKFGAWDERDPKSGEGFTVIFNKVKEEKQITAAKFPPVQVQPDTSKNREKNEPRRKIFCCLF